MQSAFFVMERKTNRYTLDLYQSPIICTVIFPITFQNYPSITGYPKRKNQNNVPESKAHTGGI